jgi:hypothetical protein
MSQQHISLQMGYETNETLYMLNEDIYGHVGRIIRRFYHNPDCRTAFENYFCFINFPRCDPEKDLTLPTCRSACENFFKSCNYAKDLWRCGPAKYFNGYSSESPSDGNIYLREYFPGQPFRQNKYDREGRERPICTPAVTGAAMGTRLTLMTLLLALTATLFMTAII